MGAEARHRRRSQQERSETTRQQLIAAAMELFGRKGYAGTTLKDVGEMAGVSAGLAAYHFGSKQALLAAVVADIQNAASERIGRPGPSADCDEVEALVANYLLAYRLPADENRLSGGDHGRALFVAIAEAISSHPELLPEVVDSDARFRQMVARTLRRGAANGILDPQIDVEALSIIIVGMLRGIALQWLVEPEAVDLDRVVAVIGQLLRPTSSS